MIIQARAARPQITMDGKDYYTSLAPYFVSMSVEDNCDGKKADDLEIRLADRDKRFINDWAPQKGAFLDVGIIAERWFAPFAGAILLDCGRFWIDSVEFSLPDHTVSVKATSIPTNTRIKGSVETRGWEEANLKDLANQIAQENKMEAVDWQSDTNPRYLRTEQHEESALAFLMKRCNDAKLAVKVHRNKIIVYDEQKMEEDEAKFTLLYGNATGAIGASYRMAGGTFTSTVVDKIKKAKVKHMDLETGEVQQGEAEDEEDDGGEEDENDSNTSEDTDSESDGDGIGDPSLRAEEGSATQYNAADTLKAKSNLRDKNKHKFVATIHLSIGNPLIASGMTFNLKGVGQYDGKWFIESIKHELGPAFTTDLAARKCLTGY